MRTQTLTYGFALTAIALLSGTSAGTRAARAQEDATASAAARVEFDHPGGGTATVEVDLPAGLLGDIVGLGDAAIAGVAEGLLKANASAEASSDVKLATDQLAGIRTIIGSLKGAVGEVRLRVYEDREAGSPDAGAVADHYAKKLEGTAWSRIVNIRDGEDRVTVFMMRDDGAIRGVFVVAGKPDDLVLANVLCDLSPERIKQITQQATSIGLELGGDEALREIVKETRGR
jgi:hypothetical protein